MFEAPEYAKQSNIFIEQARDELRQGDLRQASEKSWGAAAQMVKAVAQQKGWAHQSHRDLFRTVEMLKDNDLIDMFGNATALHLNFYEGWLPQSTVALHLNLVEQLINKLRYKLVG